MKNWKKGLLALAFTGVLVLTGCSTIKDVSNDQSGIVYNGGSVVSVGDHLFYANAFESGVTSFDTSSSSEYDNASRHAYLARTNKAEYAGTEFENPTKVEKISDKLVGYSNMYMFVCGDYIYYATPNIHKTSENKHIWTYVSIYRCRLNGKDNKELFTTTAYNSSTAQIRALSYNNKDYLVIYDGANINILTLGNKVTSKFVSDGVTSVALPDEGEAWDGNIYFTTDRNSTAGQSGNIVYKASVTNGDKVKICQENGLTITFTGRVANNLFYTRKQNDISETYKLDLEVQTGSFATAGRWFYALEIFDVEGVAEGNDLYNGYLFCATRSSTTQVMYYNTFEASQNVGYSATVFVESAYADTVTVFRENFYYTTSDKMIKKNVVSGEEETIVSDMSIRSGYFGYDFKYVDGNITRLNNIYFYATRVYDKDAEDYDESAATDTKNYLYGVDASGVETPKLISQLI